MPNNLFEGDGLTPMEEFALETAVAECKVYAGQIQDPTACMAAFAAIILHDR